MIYKRRWLLCLCNGLASGARPLKKQHGVLCQGQQRSQAGSLGEQRPFTASYCPGSWSPTGARVPREPGNIFLQPAPSRRHRTAPQCHPEAASASRWREFLSLNGDSGGLPGSGWYFGGLEVCLAELYLEKVTSGCVAVHSVPSEPVSCSCHPTSSHPLTATMA